MSATVRHIVIVLAAVLMAAPRASAQVADAPGVPAYVASQGDGTGSAGLDGEDGSAEDPLEAGSHALAGVVDDQASLDSAPVAPASLGADPEEDQRAGSDAPGLAGRARRALGAGGAAVGVAVAGTLERWGVSPVVALLGLVGALLMVWGGRSVLIGRRAAAPEPPRRRRPARTSRLRPPRRPACRDAARLEEALRARKVA